MERTPLTTALLLSLAMAACRAADSAGLEDLRTAPPVIEGQADAPGWLASSLGEPVHIEARDLVLQLGGAVVRVVYLSGELIPAGDYVDLEAPESFEVRVSAVEIVIAEQTIEAAMSGGEKPPFRELTVRTDGDSLAIEGSAGGLGVPFRFRAQPRLSDGALVFELEKAQVIGVGVKGFLEAFQRSIEEAANEGGHLIDIDGDQLVLDPFPFPGPPEVYAEFTSFEVRERDLVARLGELTPAEEGEGDGRLVLSGGAVRTGHAILFDTTLRLVAKEGGDLVIDPGRLDAQIEGGFLKQGADGSTTLHLVAPGDPS